MSSDRHSKRLVDYEKTVAYFGILHEARFKILAFMPLLAGAALAALTGTNLSPHYEFGVAVFGGLITLGLISYDQRNTQIYDRLVRRAKFLERQLGFQALPGDEHGGAFHCRPPLWRIRIRGHNVFLIWHSLGLAMVYATCLSVWTFAGLDALSRRFLNNGPEVTSMLLRSLVILLPTACTFLGWLVVSLVLSQASYRENKRIDDRYQEFRSAGQSEETQVGQPGETEAK